MRFQACSGVSEMTENECLIKVSGLTLSYENMTVISGMSFNVSSGDYLCIVGENGSGKSTLV